MNAIFRKHAPDYWVKGFPTIPLNGKAPIPKGWQHYLNGPPKAETRQEWLDRNGNSNLGILTGISINEDFALFAVDGDANELIAVIETILGRTPCSKIGKKGRTDFARVAKSAKVKSGQIRDCNGVGKVDMAADVGTKIEIAIAKVDGFKKEQIRSSFLPLAAFCRTARRFCSELIISRMTS